MGRVHEQPRMGMPTVDRFNRLQWEMEVFPFQIDQFACSQEETTPTKGELVAMRQVPEVDVKNAFAEILGEPFVPSDWGGEQSDLVTSYLKIEGAPVVTAFALKGRSVPRPLTIAEMGKHGDQAGRLFTGTSDFVVVQHCNHITSAVRLLMRAFAMRPGQIKPFCLLDGAYTVQILRAYGKLGFSSRKRKSKSLADSSLEEPWDLIDEADTVE